MQYALNIRRFCAQRTNRRRFDSFRRLASRSGGAKILRAFPVVLAFLVLACRQETATLTTPTTTTPKVGEHMAHVTSKDGTKIAFEKTGSGPAVIIVSGGLTHRNIHRDKYTSLTEKLSKHFTTYIYDRRGRGGSTDVQPYAVAREIEDIEALIYDAGGRAYLYGVSGGAALSLQAAAKLGPAKVPKLALYELPYGQEKQEFDAQKQRVNELVRTGAPGEAAAFFFSAIGTPPEALEAMKSSPEWEAIKKIDFTLVYDYEVLGDGAVPHDIITAIAVPTLVMDGEKGVPFIHATVDQIAKLIPGAQRRTLKGQTHQAEAEVLAPVLIEFFTGEKL
jgi:pimeloyl-ACP methyl ester carboxylesterase